MPQAYGPLPARVQAARHDETMVVLEGVHAVKHALRFGAELTLACSPDPTGMHALLADLAPDVATHDALAATVEVTDDVWAEMTGGRGLPSPLLALTRRPTWALTDVRARHGRTVVLEAPRHHGNLGAAIRVAAAANAAGVVVLGGADPWHPTSVRAAAGLHFAVPVVQAPTLAAGATVFDGETRPRIAIDPGGSEGTATPGDAVLVFGTERGGLSSHARAHCTTARAIPMQAGVSSLNLATAVAVLLYADVANGRE